MAKERNHNEWFQPIIAGGRKSCPNCKEKLNSESVWAWGEYVNGKWRTVRHFCRSCFPTQVLKPLKDHAGPCGCTITLCARSGYGPLPEWLTLAHEKESVECGTPSSPSSPSVSPV